MVTVLNDPQQVREALQGNAWLDCYVGALTRPDLVARRAVDRNVVYARLYDSVLPDPSPHAVARLQQAVQHCEDALLRDTLLQGALHAVRFCLTVGEELEDGMPFTLADIVFLPVGLLETAWDSLCDTLVHEATHVWQRMQPKLVAAIVQGMWGFEHLSDFEYRQLALAGRPVRTNPDTVHQQYRLGSNVWLFEFSSHSPRSLSDGSPVSVDLHTGAKRPSHYEHPYEMMAYMVPMLLRGRGAGSLPRGLRSMYAQLRSILVQKRSALGGTGQP